MNTIKPLLEDGPLGLSLFKSAQHESKWQRGEYRIPCLLRTSLWHRWNHQGERLSNLTALQGKQN